MAQRTTVSIQESTAGPTVQLRLPDGGVWEGRRGLPLREFLVGLDGDYDPVVGGVVNGELRELTYPIEMESTVRPVTLADADGMRIYRRSLTFLLAAAFEEMFPRAELHVDHSVASGGYHCQVYGRPSLHREELSLLQKRMKQLVEQDLPFAKTQVKLEEAMEFFRSRGQHDKVRLLAHRRKPHMIIYEMGGHRDYHHGYMVPRTG